MSRIGMTGSRTTRLAIYAVRIAAILEKKFSLYFYPSFIETVTGNGSQMSEVSWWPTPTHWNNHNSNGFNWGHWTEWDEVWYQQRVKDILSGHKAGVPLTQSTWRSKLKGAKPWREVTKRVEDEWKAFF